MARPTFKQVLGENPKNLHVQLTATQYTKLNVVANDNQTTKADVLRALIDQWLDKTAMCLTKDRAVD